MVGGGVGTCMAGGGQSVQGCQLPQLQSERPEQLPHEGSF